MKLEAVADDADLDLARLGVDRLLRRGRGLVEQHRAEVDGAADLRFEHLKISTKPKRRYLITQQRVHRVFD